jgi:hypothetical protein
MAVHDLHEVILTTGAILGFMKHFVSRDKSSTGFKITLAVFRSYTVASFNPVGKIENLAGITLQPTAARILNTVSAIVSCGFYDWFDKNNC